MDGRHPSGLEVLDGYRLIRFLGRGGFAEVWLCRSEAMGDYRALKWLPAGMADRLQKEYDSLVLYRNAAASLRSPHLVPVEHINRTEAGLFYVMPLADGMADGAPADPEWQPKTLAAVIEARVSAPEWFSSEEIQSYLAPVLLALQTLSDAGLVHRDVKPDNILFFNGSPRLGDISLLGEDASTLTRRGTPGYATPTWYCERGGNPDMYGAAATLYTLLTGNSPDKMGRAAFLWPPQGEVSLSEAARGEWKRLHAVIRRATEEQVAERFIDFTAMAGALGNKPTAAGVANARPVRRSFAAFGSIVLVLATIGIALAVWAANQFAASDSESAPQSSTAVGTSTLPKVKRSLRDSNNASHGLEDANLACNSLEWIIANRQGLMSGADLDLLRDTLEKIRISIRDPDHPDYKAAAGFLDDAVKAIPTLKEQDNVTLARLVLLQCGGDRSQADEALSNPSFMHPGNDNLSYRVELLSRLGGHWHARQLLDNVVASGTTSRREKSRALMERARLRADFADHQGAFRDAGMAFELAENDPAEKSARMEEHNELQEDNADYAAFVKTQPEK